MYVFVYVYIIGSYHIFFIFIKRRTIACAFLLRFTLQKYFNKQMTPFINKTNDNNNKDFSHMIINDHVFFFVEKPSLNTSWWIYFFLNIFDILVIVWFFVVVVVVVVVVVIIVSKKKNHIDDVKVVVASSILII